ncbi:hypothetical protein, partial [Paludisphaera rhizosphaerae]|uniref:hypothetical protein n=1 Tax=Paludisphaera rhizosphaerae TaxID=2711216 RepID=UPI00197FC629
GKALLFFLELPRCFSPFNPEFVVRFSLRLIAWEISIEGSGTPIRGRLSRKFMGQQYGMGFDIMGESLGPNPLSIRETSTSHNGFIAAAEAAIRDTSPFGVSVSRSEIGNHGLLIFRITTRADKKSRVRK